MTIIVDSDGLIGLLNRYDHHNAAATKILDNLIQKEAKLIYPATVIVEATTVLQVRLKKPELATSILELLLDGQFIIDPVDETILKHASLLLPSNTEKHNTLFDAIVVTTAQNHKADAIFSFDKWYKQLGFTLASEIL